VQGCRRAVEERRLFLLLAPSLPATKGNESDPVPAVRNYKSLLADDRGERKNVGGEESEEGGELKGEKKTSARRLSGKQTMKRETTHEE